MDFTEAIKTNKIWALLFLQMTFTDYMLLSYTHFLALDESNKKKFDILPMKLGPALVTISGHIKQNGNLKIERLQYLGLRLAVALLCVLNYAI